MTIPYDSLEEAFKVYFALMAAGGEVDESDNYPLRLAFLAGALAGSWLEPKKIRAEILAFDATESARFGLPSGFDKTPR